MAQNPQIASNQKIDFDSLKRENLDEKTKNQKSNKIISLDQVIELTNLMIKGTENELDAINAINKKMEFLALNALIEASRAESSEKGFKVVAESIDVLSKKTKEVVEKMQEETITEMQNLVTAIQKQSSNIRGNRLSDLALTTIDIIDRNLYERTADVRWWATDETLVNSLSQKTANTTNNATERLKTILKSYTVYYDLILCDLQGNVLTNSKPDKFNLKNRNFSDRIWFQTALKTKNGEEYGFQTVHRSRKSGDSTLTFSCIIHEDGNINNKPIGVLAAVFDWMGLAKKILDDAGLNEYEKKTTRICLVDNLGTILADTQNKVYGQINFPNMFDLFKEKKGFRIVDFKGEKQLIAHGLSPGYENYSSGWHCLIINNLKHV